MTKKLSDPDLLAGEIVRVLDDGRAIRNDGVELKPASENPWYVLATIAGEQNIGDVDEDLHNKNRRFWNGWACGDLKHHQKVELAKKAKLPIDELAPLTKLERATLEAEFQKRLGHEVKVPDPLAGVDFSRTHFDRSTSAVLKGFIFRVNVSFSSVTFSGDAWFDSAIFRVGANFAFAGFFERARFISATFSGFATFESATFDAHALFTSAAFGGNALFTSATFSLDASFTSATFSLDASFTSATVNRDAQFRSASFGGDALFDSAAFMGHADFSDGTFESRTTFEGARFCKGIPMFYQRRLHQDTAFTTVDSYWPDITDNNAAGGKRAYTRLRQLMNELHKPDDEHFFFRQEMKCDAILKEGWDRRIVQAFGWVSDYGYGVVWPATVLIWLWALPVAIYARSFGAGCWAHEAAIAPGCLDVRMNAVGEAIGFSFASLFGFFGLQRLHFDAAFWAELPGPLHFLSGAQTVLGFVFLFFLGLGLRNRFRLK